MPLFGGYDNKSSHWMQVNGATKCYFFQLSSKDKHNVKITKIGRTNPFFMKLKRTILLVHLKRKKQATSKPPNKRFNPYSR